MTEATDVKKVKAEIVDSVPNYMDDYQTMKGDFDVNHRPSAAKSAEDVGRDVNKCRADMSDTSKEIKKLTEKQNDFSPQRTLKDKVMNRALMFIPERMRRTLGVNPKASLEDLANSQMSYLKGQSDTLEKSVKLLDHYMETGQDAISELENIQTRALEAKAVAEGDLRLIQERKEDSDKKFKDYCANNDVCGTPYETRKLEYSKEQRLLKRDAAKKKGIIGATDSNVKKIENLKKAHEILIDEGLDLVIGEASEIQETLSSTYDSLTTILPAQIAAGAAIQTVANAAAGYHNIQGSFNALYEVLGKAALALPAISASMKGTEFYDPEVLENTRDDFRGAKLQLEYSGNLVLGEGKDVKSKTQK